MTIRNMPFSFAQLFVSGTNYNVPEFVLPIHKHTELSFQVLIIPDNPTERQQFIDEAFNDVYAVKSDAVITDANALELAKLDLNVLGNIYYYPVGDNILGVVKINASITEMVAYDTCFRYAVDAFGTYFGFFSFVSNIFKSIENIRHTTLLRYSCDENSNGFIYCGIGDYSNAVRLPFRLWKPQFVDEENVYVRSDGSRKITKSVTSKEYEGVTDYLPIDVHEKLKQALSSDYVDVESDDYSGGIVKDGNYEIAYPDFIFQEQYQATFKAFATPYLMRNDSCGSCGEQGV